MRGPVGLTHGPSGIGPRASFRKLPSARPEGLPMSPQCRVKSDNQGQVIRSVALLALLALVLTACFGDSEPMAAETERANSSPTATEAVTSCPITLPNRSVPVDATDWGPSDSHGNGQLWTLLWPYGVVLAPPDW